MITIFHRNRHAHPAAQRTSVGRTRPGARDIAVGVGYRRVSPGGHLPSQAPTTRVRPY